MSKIRKCSKCGRELLLTEEFFHRGKAYTDGFRRQCKECVATAERLYRWLNKGSVSETHKRYNQVNKPIIAIKSREYQELNKESVALSKKIYKESHREEFRVYNHNRRAKKRNLPATLTATQWKDAKLAFDNTCAYCGESKPLTQDHFVACLLYTSPSPRDRS